jgi:hypothetical protein
MSLRVVGLVFVVISASLLTLFFHQLSLFGSNSDNEKRAEQMQSLVTFSVSQQRKQQDVLSKLDNINQQVHNILQQQQQCQAQQTQQAQQLQQALKTLLDQQMKQVQQTLKDQQAQQVQKVVQKPKFYSQFGEDKFLLEKYFKDQRNGFYLELGALDGIEFSNTKYFQDALDWTGVLIEPVPDSYKRLKVNRPRDTTLHMAICQEEKMIEIIGDHAVAGIADKIPSNHPKIFHSLGKVKNNVFCGPIGKYLRIVGVEKIDFWSLDVEGAEIDVLKTMDWSIPIRLIMTEALPNESGAEQAAKNEQVRVILREKGFRMDSTVHWNEIWVNDRYPLPAVPIAAPTSRSN